MQTKPSDMDDLTRAARVEINEAKATLQDAAGKVQQEAMKAGRTISDIAMDELDRRVTLLGQNGRQVAGILRDASGQIDGPGARVLGHVVDTLDEMSSRLEGQSARALAADVARLGRTHPTAFMLGCLVTGVVAGRMIAAGPKAPRDTDEAEPRDDDDVTGDDLTGTYSTPGSAYVRRGRKGKANPDSTGAEGRPQKYDTPDSVMDRESDA